MTHAPPYHVPRNGGDDPHQRSHCVCARHLSRHRSCCRGARQPHFCGHRDVPWCHELLAHCHPDVRSGWGHHECRRHLAPADRDGIGAHRIRARRTRDGERRRVADLCRDFRKRCRRRRRTGICPDPGNEAQGLFQGICGCSHLLLGLPGHHHSPVDSHDPLRGLGRDIRRAALHCRLHTRLDRRARIDGGLLCLRPSLQFPSRRDPQPRKREEDIRRSAALPRPSRHHPWRHLLRTCDGDRGGWPCCSRGIAGGALVRGAQLEPAQNVNA